MEKYYAISFCQLASQLIKITKRKLDETFEAEIL